MKFPFHRIAIVNRAEPARRLMHAVHELNDAHDAGLKTIALYTEPDARALFVREADESYCLGPATVPDPATGKRRSSYLNHERLSEALRATSAEAAWVGWGFVAEDADFADLCRHLGVVFIGPDGGVMRRLGDKVAAKQLAEQAGVPVAPWSKGPVATARDAAAIAAQLGYPVVVKACNGGGGRGIRTVAAAEAIEDSFEQARSEALLAFGDDAVFIEKMVRPARHLEVQIIADQHGTCWALGARDCSVQRRHQKVIEEAPPPGISAELLQELGAAAERLAKMAGYHNAGTMECLLDTTTQQFCFMEMNTRLQVEHPVTEVTTGVDLVKLQLHVAAGGRLEGPRPPTRGHAIEVRLNAEDPDSQFAPAPGQITRLRLPSGPGLRVDTGVAEGDHIPPDFDSMIAKIIAHGSDRAEAIARLKRALLELLVTLDGGTSNKAFLLHVLKEQAFLDASIDVNWLDRLMVAESSGRAHADVALIWAAIEVYMTEHAAERTQFLASAGRGRPRFRDEGGLEVKVRYQGGEYDLTVHRRGVSEYGVAVDGHRCSVTTRRLGEYEGWLYSGERHYHIVSQPRGMDHLIEVDGIRHRVSRDEGGVVRAPSPGLVVAVVAKPGQEVKAGDPLVVLEAMKLESPVPAPANGRIREVLVEPNVQVDAATPLVIVEPSDTHDDADASAERVTFARVGATMSKADHDAITASPADLDSMGIIQYKAALATLEQLMLGFELWPGERQRLLVQLTTWQQRAQSDDLEVRTIENRVLSLFVHTVQLYSDPQGDLRERGSGADYLQAFVRALGSHGETLQQTMLERLKRVLAHYDEYEVAACPTVEDAILWNYKAFLRAEQAAPAIQHILTRRLGVILDSESPPDTNFVRLLERIIDATHHRYLDLHDLARQIQYRGLHRPQLERARRTAYESYTRLMDEISQGDGRSTSRQDRIDRLVDSPQPMAGFLSRWLASADDTPRCAALESLVRRYYRTRNLHEIAFSLVDGVSILTGRLAFEGNKRTVVAFACAAERLEQAVASAVSVCEELPHSSEIVVDAFVLCDQPRPDLAEKLTELASQQVWRGRTGRICFCLLDPAHQHDIDYVTFAVEGERPRKLEHYRGIHPMWAGRLELWRMRNFRIQRVPGPQDIYLYHAVARNNPKDERFFTYVDVRDCTPIRDKAGTLVQMTGFEWMFLESMDSLRDAQQRRSRHQRLQWNRVLFYLWGPLPVTVDEIATVIRRLAPATANLGLERLTCRISTPDSESRETADQTFHFLLSDGRVVNVRETQPHDKPVESLSPYYQKVVWARRRGMTYPYELIQMMTPASYGTAAVFPSGEFIEHDLDEQGQLVPVDRPIGENSANVVVGLIRNITRKFLEGMTRVILLGDPTKEMGALSEPECRRIIAAIDLADKMKIPLEWFPISSGAKISLESGTENLDWTARVLQRLVQFTEVGGEVNIVVAGVNVGAQSYWNAEATMLMHTRGILIMTPEGSMVLTGKRALDYSGGVSAEDNRGIGGVRRIMGPNGEAQYLARDLTEATHLLFRYYDLTYVAPGERFPRRAPTSDSADRDVTTSPLSGDQSCGFSTVGEIFSATTNPARKKPFDIRGVMQAVVDKDSDRLERWAMMRSAEIAVVWDVHLGGMPVCMLGIESRPLERLGFIPGDGPDLWNAGTLFPLSSKKVARAINAASGKRPVVVLANLSGFDGSPESMRRLQLEYGAEIGRAVVKFEGPMVFCVVSRYHGGAYVVFSRTLNPQLTVAALEGSYASVIGGAPAAAVVLAREVKARATHDERLRHLQQDLAHAPDVSETRMRHQISSLFRTVQLEKQTELANEFDRIHDVHRAKSVGSLDTVLAADRLRPFLIGAVKEGMSRTGR